MLLNRSAAVSIWVYNVDQDMKGTVHIDYVYRKLIKYVGMFYKLRNKVPPVCLRNIYFSYVHSVLLYGIELYANTYASHWTNCVKLIIPCCVYFSLNS